MLSMLLPVTHLCSCLWQVGLGRGAPQSVSGDRAVGRRLHGCAARREVPLGRLKGLQLEGQRDVLVCLHDGGKGT